MHGLNIVNLTLIHLRVSSAGHTHSDAELQELVSCPILPCYVPHIPADTLGHSVYDSLAFLTRSSCAK